MNNADDSLEGLFSEITPSSNSTGEFLRECQNHLDTIREYCKLAMFETLTDEQADRINAIYEKAEIDPLFSFLIDEADHIIGHELGLINAESVHRNQEKLRQIIDQSWVNQNIQRGRLKQKAQVPERLLKTAQARLTEQGFYDGPIDGEYSLRTEDAFKRLEEKFHEELREQGLCPNPNSRTCGLTISEAVKLIKEKGLEGSIDQKADLLSLQSWLLHC